MDHFYLEQGGCALSVRCNVLCQPGIHITKSFCKFFVILILFLYLCITRLTVCQKKNRIIGGGVSIHGNHVVSILYTVTERFLEQLFADIHIRGHKPKHGAHVGMDHAGTFTHTANGNFFAVYLCLYRDFFLYRICGHNGFCCQCARCLRF